MKDLYLVNTDKHSKQIMIRKLVTGVMDILIWWKYNDVWFHAAKWKVRKVILPTLHQLRRLMG